LVLCAVAVGVARAALAEAIATMKTRGQTASGDERVPHWALADAAAEIDAARLLMLSAAQLYDRGADAAPAIALARSLAAPTAERAVEAAIRSVGSSSYQVGSLLERLSRDARTLSFVVDSVDQSRDCAAPVYSRPQL
jgi:alkylation response protein AidB-like acyl-CoA dehydrogenase